MRKVAVNEFYEIISDATKFSPKDQMIVEYSDLPEVTDELSVTLRLKLKSHASNWATIFHKGSGDFIRTPSLWLTANKSSLHARFTGNWDWDAGITDLGEGFLLNRWYHLSYTLSDSLKRMDFYINGEWTGYCSIQKPQAQKVVFNDGPLHIGRAFSADGFDGEISNFRYFNWRLSPEEVKKNFSNQDPFN
ncbi:concanavalin A-like lectin/glucanase domain-containing protein [Glomus cerebriforme]|uniref:Concanavalin A-like lectin/glucanase domain-containing protein n=1 Tax=Glomus cerebriforme TaxID=658196 RepID=A0A397SNL1_9GLOM|nr:concanavalin A-like lectin/glucanase domain-containing protein [Glomus cerebriforme]